MSQEPHETIGSQHMSEYPEDNLQRFARSPKYTYQASCQAAATNRQNRIVAFGSAVETLMNWSYSILRKLVISLPEYSGMCTRLPHLSDRHLRRRHDLDQ